MFLLLLGVLGIAQLSPTQRAGAQIGSADEYAIRAAMLLNLARFVEWPAAKLDGSHPQFVVCILGVDPIGPYVDHFLENHFVSGKPVRVVHLESLNAAGSCHILYIAAGQSRKQNRALADVMKGGVLTVSEEANTPGLNQVIGLPTVEEHVQIEVDLGAAQKAGLTISSKLLRLARVTY